MFGTASDSWSQAPRRVLWQRCLQLAPIRIVLGVLFFVPTAILANLKHHWWLELLETAAFLLSLVAFTRVVERRKANELGASGAALEWLGGFLLGIALLAGTTGILVLFGAYRIEHGGQLMALRTGILMFMPQSLFEELLMRAIFFKIAEEAIGSWAAMALQAALFGALHLGNPGATVAGAIAIAFEAGILLAATYMLTRRIWLAWGLHLGWNWMQGSFFGIRVSGTKVASSWLVATPIGSSWLNGGAFGAEASPVAVVLCVLAAIVILRAAIRRGQLVGYRAQRARLRYSMQ